MKFMRIALCVITFAAAVLFVCAAIGGHDDSYAPAAVLLAAATATAQQCKRTRDRR